MSASAQPFPENESERIKSLLEYQILDSAKDEQLDELTQFTGHFFQVPIALITILDENRQWFKSNIGLPVHETQRSISFCQYTILKNEVFEVPDTRLDERFSQNPLVLEEPFMRYYCGAPLINEGGYCLGSLALIDKKPRKLSETQKKQLVLLAQQVVNFFELNQKRKQLIKEKENLEKKVHQRTLQLEKLNASKDKFFSIIAHDLLSPVNGLIGSANILTSQMEGLSRDEIRQFVQGIFVSAHQLKRLLSNLLEWASMQTGEMLFQPKVISLHKIAHDTIELLQENAHQKEVKVENRIGENIQVSADENMVHSIFRNLLANAIKFSKLGGHILLYSKLIPGQVQVSIRDTGVGMSKEIQEKIFQLDVKRSTLGTSGEKGTGLGLLLCKEFIEQHGGRIWVESQEGKGATFSFTLPI